MEDNKEQDQKNITPRINKESKDPLLHSQDIKVRSFVGISSPVPGNMIGSVLRQARENLGQSLSVVSQELCVREHYLRAIEESRFQDLPASIYALGFVRSYAEYLGLDPNDVVRRFRQESQQGSVGNVKADLSFPEPEIEQKGPSRKIFIICLALIIGGYLVWHFWFDNSGTAVVEKIEQVPGQLVSILNQPTNIVPQPQQNTPQPEQNSNVSENTNSVEQNNKVPTPGEEPVPTSEITGPIASGLTSSSTNDVSTPIINNSSINEPLSDDKKPIIEALKVAPVKPIYTGSTDYAINGDPLKVSPMAGENQSNSSDEEDTPPPTVVDTPVNNSSNNLGKNNSETKNLEPSKSNITKNIPVKPSTTATTLPNMKNPLVTQNPVSKATNLIGPTNSTVPVNSSNQVNTVTTSPSTPPLPTSVAPTSVANNQPINPVPSNPSPATSVPTAPAKSNTRIMLRARMESWVQIKNAKGERIWGGVLRPGQTYEVPNEAGLTMSTGNAGGIDIMVDGRLVPSIGSVGVPKQNISLEPDKFGVR
ncbi:MAG: DUF4115 domain-containing protein [Alphaproteobacteria bacterium]|nr:DUF4115 domain-containing protein [Alphaproteobacteria bacterium]